MTIERSWARQPIGNSPPSCAGQLNITQRTHSPPTQLTPCWRLSPMAEHKFSGSHRRTIRLSRRFVHSLSCAALMLVPCAGMPAFAAGQGKLEAHYVASLAGIPIGKGVWVVDVVDDQYSAAANGKTTGLLQVFAGGHGSASRRGTVNGGKAVA